MKTTRIITEGALLLATFTILLLIFLYLPLISVISTVFLTLPFLIYSAKYTLKYTLILLIASILISALVGSVLAIPVAILYGTTGSVMGYCIRLQKSKTFLYVASSITFLLNILIEYMVSIVFFKIDILKDSINMFKKSFEQSTKMIESLDLGSSKELVEQMNAAIGLIQTLLPTLMVISAFLIVWLILAVNLPIVKRFGIKVTKWGAFRDLKIPKSILWYYLLTVVIMIIFRPNQNEYLGMALVNLSYILQILLLLQGFSLIYFIGYEKKWPKAILVVITIFSILISPLQYIIRVLGIIDLGFDIRSYILSKKSK